MADEDFKLDLALRQKKHNDNFKNYENAVALVSSLEAWFEYRWGASGKERPGLLESFNRFPLENGLTPDFEVRFHTPYVLWGDHKRTMQPSSRGADDVDQIIKYAARRPQPVVSPAEQSTVPKYDVMVLVNTENDNIAAKAIHAGKTQFEALAVAAGAEASSLAPIVVLGCHLDRESTKEWYKLKWRDHHENQRFSTPNVCADTSVPDLNSLIADASHLAIPVNKSALDKTGRNPFMNDAPPAFYTAIRLVVPAINDLLTEDERDVLQTTGKVEKSLCKNDILGTSVVTSMKFQPKGLGKWIDAAFDFMASDLRTARRLANTQPQQYIVTLDNNLLKNDPLELWSERAASTAAKQAVRATKRKRTAQPDRNQPTLFGSE